MKKLIVVVSVFVLIVGAMGVAAANGDSQRNAFKARLGGYQEVPSISTTGSGELRLKVNPAGTEIAYTLTYSSLQGGAANAAHIHFAQSGVIGGVLAWLCGGGGKPGCPAVSGTVEGTIVAADIQVIAAQGIAAGAAGWPSALRAIRAGVTYANVHTATFGSGEIRGQISAHGQGKKD